MSSKKIRCLIVDDEELARNLLQNFIERLPHLEVAGQCKDPLEAMAMLQNNKIDLVFLDIQMPGLTGVEFLRSMKITPLVIFTTAYPEYALEGYSLDVVDYLLKPFSFERFVQAVNKATARLQAKHPVEAPAANAPVQEPAKDYILVKADYKLHRIKLDDIQYIESMREYVAYHTPNGRLLSLQSLKSLEEELPADRFIRIHKSYIVPIDKIEALEGNMVHIGKAKLPVGASYREGLMERVFKQE
jgi:DNA-binding LytR/AlgR family response regulator